MVLTTSGSLSQSHLNSILCTRTLDILVMLRSFARTTSLLVYLHIMFDCAPTHIIAIVGLVIELISTYAVLLCEKGRGLIFLVEKRTELILWMIVHANIE